MTSRDGVSFGGRSSVRTSEPLPMRAPACWPARMAAITIVVLGFIPWAALLPVGLEMPGLAAQLRDWGTGSLLALGVGVLVWFSSKRGHWPVRAPESSSADARLLGSLGPMTRVCLVACGALLLYAIVATAVFSRRPLLIDEVAQMWQAQRYAEGQLWLPVPVHREFFSFLHLVDVGDRVFAQFPPGGPFMIWLGVLAGGPWLVGPFCGAVSVWLFSRLARAAEPNAGDRWNMGATLLFALTPFGVFMFGSYMNHATALFWILLAVVALVGLVDSEGPSAASVENGASVQIGPFIGAERPGGRGVRLLQFRGRAVVLALVLGFGLGAAATIRPLDAFAFALPAAIWLVARAGRSPQRWFENICAGIGVVIPFAAMMYVNAQTTGHPLQFGYEVLWGTTHGLGFHAAPWGEPHTPLRGLALASLYQWRLQSYLFETPFPSLILPVMALAFARRASALDRYLLASSGLIVLFYLLYWHDGFYLGPRFVLPLLPGLVLWTARLPLVIRAHVTSVHVRRALVSVLAFGVVGAAVFNLPVRIATYRAGLTSMRVDYAAAARRSGVHSALVFVRESWGAQLVARLWALGVSRPMAESVYRGTDTCNLEQEVSLLEHQGVRGTDAEQHLRILLHRDSAFVVKSELTPDPTERMRLGVQYTPTCVQRIADDRAGFLHYAPLRLVTTGDNIYARDLHARDSLLLAEYSGRPVYLLTRAGTRVDDRLTFVPLNRDSLYLAWRSRAP
jgi:hypothetical protein